MPTYTVRLVRVSTVTVHTDATLEGDIIAAALDAENEMPDEDPNYRELRDHSITRETPLSVYDDVRSKTHNRATGEPY